MAKIRVTAQVKVHAEMPHAVGSVKPDRVSGLYGDVTLDLISSTTVVRNGKPYRIYKVIRDGVAVSSDELGFKNDSIGLGAVVDALNSALTANFIAKSVLGSDVAERAESIYLEIDIKDLTLAGCGVDHPSPVTSQFKFRVPMFFFKPA